MNYGSIKDSLGTLVGIPRSRGGRLWFGGGAASIEPSSLGDHLINDAYQGLFTDGVHAIEMITQELLYTEAEYTTGTVTFASGGRAVTGASTSWPTDWSSRSMFEGWMFLAGSGGIPKRIRSIESATAMTLEDFNREAAQPALSTYAIWQDAFDLPPDCQELASIYDETSQNWIHPIPPGVDVNQAYRGERGQPIYYRITGRRALMESVYKSGTCGVVSGDGTVTFATGDNFLDPFDEGRAIRFATEDIEYRIKSITSGTVLELDTPYFGTTNAGIAFSITGLETKMIELFPAPNTKRMLKLTFWRMPWRLINNADVPEIPDRYHDLILWDALIALHATDHSLLPLSNRIDATSRRYQKLRGEFNRWKKDKGRLRFRAGAHNMAHVGRRRRDRGPNDPLIVNITS